MRARTSCYGRLFSMKNFGLLIQKGSGRITLTTKRVGFGKLKNLPVCYFWQAVDSVMGGQVTF